MPYNIVQEGVSLPAIIAQLPRIPERPGEGGKWILVVDLRAPLLGVSEVLLADFAEPEPEPAHFVEFRKLVVKKTGDIDPDLTRLIFGGRDESVGDIISKMEMVVKVRRWPMCQASNFTLNKVVLLAHSMGTDVWMYRQAVYPSQSKLQQAVQDDQALDLPELEHLQLGPEFWASSPEDSILPAAVREIQDFQPQEAWTALKVVMQAIHNKADSEGDSSWAARCIEAKVHVDLLVYLTEPKLGEYLRHHLDLQYGGQPAVTVAVSSTSADLEEAPSSSHAAVHPDTAGEASDGSDGTAASSDDGDEGADTCSSSFGDEDIDAVLLEEEMTPHRQMCEASLTQAFQNLPLW